MYTVLNSYNLQTAVVYDIETFPNVFSIRLRSFDSADGWYFEISEYRDDRAALMQFFNKLNVMQTFMIGFNNINFDYPVIHTIFNNPNISVSEIYEKAMSIINSFDRWGHIIWSDDRFAPQIDLYKIHHFDNKAKSTSLKALEINMRSKTVVDMPVQVGTNLSKEQIENYLKPYNYHDVEETLKFAKHSIKAIEFRLSMCQEFGIDVLNWSDSKIGSEMMIKKIGSEICYDYSSGRRQKRQTPRNRIALNEVIFDYVRFENSEFNRVLDYMKSQVLGVKDFKEFDEKPPSVETKGVFKDLKAVINGFDYCFGAGGIHGSLNNQRVEATEQFLIRDIDVASLYPSIAIVNRLYPEHLGEPFFKSYSELPQERKRLQAEKGKKCPEANSMKLASNSVYGNSNNPYSVFYDPKYTMTITLNGQLMLCMLAEQLMKIPTLKIIQINTDGMTYVIDKFYLNSAQDIEKNWQNMTALVLEDVFYQKMCIRDVNNYIAEAVDGSIKLKGAYWTPDADNYFESVSESQPPAWHKDLSNLVSVRAAVANMLHGVDPEHYIKLCQNPFDFVLRAKVKRSDKLFFGETQIQSTSRYYVSKNGSPLFKIAPPPKGYQTGQYKKANGVSETQYKRRMIETNGQWCETVCTKNKSVYEARKTGIQTGHVVNICNDIDDFSFDNLNYDYYVNEAKKLIIV